MVSVSDTSTPFASSLVETPCRTDGRLDKARRERDKEVYEKSMTAAIMQLCGQCALALGWKPTDFWNTTPAELACVLNAMTAQTDLPPDSGDLQKLMTLFPDAPTEVNNG